MLVKRSTLHETKDILVTTGIKLHRAIVDIRLSPPVQCCSLVSQIHDARVESLSIWLLRRPFRPLCANMASSVKAKVHNTLQATSMCNCKKFDKDLTCRYLMVCSWTERHARRNTPLLFTGCCNDNCFFQQKTISK